MPQRNPTGTFSSQERPVREVSKDDLPWGGGCCSQQGLGAPHGIWWLPSPWGCQQVLREPGSKPHEGDPGAEAARRHRGLLGLVAVLYPCPHAGQRPPLLSGKGPTPTYGAPAAQFHWPVPRAPLLPLPALSHPAPGSPPTHTGVCSSPRPLGTGPGGQGWKGLRVGAQELCPGWGVLEATSDQSGAWRWPTRRLGDRTFRGSEAPLPLHYAPWLPDSTSFWACPRERCGDRWTAGKQRAAPSGAPRAPR